MSNPGERDDAPDLEDVADDIAEPEEGLDAAAEEAEGADGDEDATDDDAGEGDGSEEAAPVTAKPRSAATIAVQEAKRAAKEAKAEVEALRRERDEALRQRQGQQTAEQQRLEQERIALMAPEEKTEYLLGRQRQEFAGAINQLRFEQADNADRTAFEAMCARNPAFDAVRDEVNAEIEKMRRNGGNAPRETVAIYLIGKRALDRSSKGGKAKQAAKGASRVQSQRVAAPGGRSDVKGGERRSGNERAARAARLADQQI